MQSTFRSIHRQVEEDLQLSVDLSTNYTNLGAWLSGGLDYPALLQQAPH